MPDVGGAAYLLEILFDIGPVSSNGFGAVPISEVDIAAWQFNRGLRLKPWECQYVRRLSKEYASMLSEAGSSECPPPFFEPGALTPEVRDKIGAAFRGFTSRLRAQQQKRPPRKGG